LFIWRKTKDLRRGFQFGRVDSGEIAMSLNAKNYAYAHDLMVHAPWAAPVQESASRNEMHVADDWLTKAENDAWRATVKRSVGSVELTLEKDTFAVFGQ
jgi:hypothetical protein